MNENSLQRALLCLYTSSKPGASAFLNSGTEEDEIIVKLLLTQFEGVEIFRRLVRQKQPRIIRSLLPVSMKYFQEELEKIIESYMTDLDIYEALPAEKIMENFSRHSDFWYKRWPTFSEQAGRFIAFEALFALCTIAPQWFPKRVDECDLGRPLVRSQYCRSAKFDFDFFEMKPSLDSPLRQSAGHWLILATSTGPRLFSVSSNIFALLDAFSSPVATTTLRSHRPLFGLAVDVAVRELAAIGAICNG